MGLNKEEEEILKQIEQELMKDDPGLAKTVEDSTLSKFTRNRAVISFFVFVDICPYIQNTLCLPCNCSV